MSSGKNHVLLFTERSFCTAQSMSLYLTKRDNFTYNVAL